jgi:hypothetical protein
MPQLRCQLKSGFNQTLSLPSFELGDGEPSPPPLELGTCALLDKPHPKIDMRTKHGCKEWRPVGDGNSPSDELYFRLKALFDQWTGPTGGWLVAPEHVFAELGKILESGAAQEVSPKLLSAEQIAQKLANVGGIERWRVILQEWLDSYIAIWKQEEILWRAMVAEGDTRELKAALEHMTKAAVQWNGDCYRCGYCFAQASIPPKIVHDEDCEVPKAEKLLG